MNKVTVALAAKIARTAWVIITKPGALYERRHLIMAWLQQQPARKRPIHSGELQSSKR